MEIEEDIDLEAWKKKRKRTFYTLSILCLFLGMEYSMTFATLLLYLQNFVQNQHHTDLFYAIISSAYYIAAIISSLVIGRYTDRTRNIRSTLSICLAIIIVGNILYAIPYSPYFLLVGRFIAGIGGSIRPVVSAEIARCYIEEEALPAFSMIAIMFGLGFTLGPASNLAFVKVDFHIGPLSVNYANTPGLFMAVLFILAEVLILFFVSDLSKEHDSKAKHEGCQLDEESPLVPDSNINMGPMRVAWTLVTSFDSAIIIFTSTLSMFLVGCIDVWTPMVVVETLQWGVMEVSLVMFGAGLSSIFACVVLFFKPPSARTGYVLGVVAVFMMAATGMVLIIIITCRRHFGVVVTSFVAFDLMTGMIPLADEVFFLSALSQMVPSSFQSYGEAIRQGFAQVGALTALLTSVLLFKVVIGAAGVLSGLAVVCGVCMIIRRKQLINPKFLIQ